MIQTAIVITGMLLGQVGYRQCQTATTYQAQAQAVISPVYAQQVQNYVEKVLFLPVEREDPYYATIVHDRLRQEQRVKEKIEGETDLAAQVAKLSESISNLEKRFGELLDTPSPLAPKPDQPAPTPPKPDATPSPPPPAASTPEADKLKQEVTTLLTNNCAKCHTGESAAKGFVMFDDNDKMKTFTPLEKLLIDQEVYSGSMPKNAKPFDQESYSKLRAWIDLDRKNINAAINNCKQKGE